MVKSHFTMTSLSTSFPLILWLCMREKSSSWFKRECSFDILQLVEIESLWCGWSQRALQATRSIMEAILWMSAVPMNISMSQRSADGHDINAVDTQALNVLLGLGDEWWSVQPENEDELAFLISKVLYYSLVTNYRNDPWKYSLYFTL